MQGAAAGALDGHGEHAVMHVETHGAIGQAGQGGHPVRLGRGPNIDDLDAARAGERVDLSRFRVVGDVARRLEGHRAQQPQRPAMVGAAQMISLGGGRTREQAGGAAQQRAPKWRDEHRASRQKTRRQGA